MITLYNNLPSLDLHGIDREYAKILINDFIRDSYNSKEYNVTIIHGNGTGILKKATKETLSKNKYIESFKIDNFNSGMTIVNIKRNIDR